MKRFHFSKKVKTKHKLIDAIQHCSVKMLVPSRLETYSNDVNVKAKFTTNLCGGSLAQSKLPFKVSMDLVECSRTPNIEDGYHEETAGMVTNANS